MKLLIESHWSSSLFLVAMVVFFICLNGGSAQDDNERRNVYVVYMGERQHEESKMVTSSQQDMLSTVLGGMEACMESMIYSYKYGFSGFAANLSESQAKQISEFPQVISVSPNYNFELKTTRSWNFLGLTSDNPSKLLSKSKGGEGTIIGVIDTGIWPESASFNDDGYGRVPSRWKGICEEGELFNSSHCNRKIIGARYYTRGVSNQFLEGEYLSPRDRNGHGTHTASTSAGSIVTGVNYGGLALGQARGGAHRAHLAIYKTCWGFSRGTCSLASTLAAIDDAIEDGVDVLSLSLGGDIEIVATIHAVQRGITVVMSTGNNGPVPQSVGNRAPWVISVAASTIDRSFLTPITLGDNTTLIGQSIFNKSRQDHSFKDLITFGMTGRCNDYFLPQDSLSGKVVFCFADLRYSQTSGDYLSFILSIVRNKGGAGLIYAQHSTNSLPISPRNTPTVLVDNEVGSKIFQYIRTTRSPQVRISPSRNNLGGSVLAPKVADFSSRGPNPWLPTVLKPDIAAPGVDILAAFEDTYDLLSGTSMACPHISGIAALLKVVHPDWSPAAIKSALVTTASTVDGNNLPIMAEGIPRKVADPFDYGGGQVNPNRAMHPGLIFDIDKHEYNLFLCSNIFLPGNTKRSKDCTADKQALYDFNLPSIVIPDLKTTVTVSRTVTNVGNINSIYRTKIHNPNGIDMKVEPSVLVFNSSTSILSFKVTLSSTRFVQGIFTFGSISFLDGKHSVIIPVAVRPIIQDFFSDI